MIYTITLNTALDRTLSVRKINTDDSNRIEEERRYAGGKGVDVSKVLTNLGIRNKALGFVGGFAGDELEGILLNEGVSCDFIRVSGETRTNIIINDIYSGTQTMFNACGPQIRPYELMRLIHKLEELEEPEYVVISGSLPPGVQPEVYRKIMEIVKDRGARVILDTDGKALKAGIYGHPHYIKPNLHELSRLAGRELNSEDQIVEAAETVRGQGIETVFVSMGVSGILLVGKEDRFIAVPPEVEATNTIGAGDSAVAGFIYGMLQEHDLKKALVCAVAAGTATTLRPGTALCQKEDFLELVPQVKLREMI